MHQANVRFMQEIGWLWTFGWWSKHLLTREPTNSVLLFIDLGLSVKKKILYQRSPSKKKSSKPTSRLPSFLQRLHCKYSRVRICVTHLGTWCRIYRFIVFLFFLNKYSSFYSCTEKKNENMHRMLLKLQKPNGIS